MTLETESVDKRTLAVCLTNRAQCHIRLEEFGITLTRYHKLSLQAQQ